MSEAASVLAGPSPTTGAEATTGQAAAPVETVTQAPEGLPEWAKDFSPAAQSVIAAKKWAKPEQAVESYANLEKLLGGDKIALPKDENDPAWADVWKKLGALEKPDEYAGMVKPAEGVPDLDPGFVGAMSDLAAKARLTPAQWNTLVAGYQELSKAAAAEEAAGPDIDAEFAAFKAKLGAKADAFIADAQRAGMAVNMTAEESATLMSALGVERAMQIMSGLGSKFGKEAGFIEGKGPQGQMTPEMARARIAELGNDPVWRKSYLEGDSGKKAEMENLQKIATGVA
ncbi:MAG: hypothetical protein WAT70_03835 [Rhizobiaceae bacterium]